MMLRVPCLMIIVHTTMAFYKMEYLSNVGTVLFTASDLKKHQWNIADIDLLEARRYFQKLLPPPSFVRTLNPEYVDLLFHYFREAYSAIKKETQDPVMDRLLTTALSDSIGGYLKALLLPIAKFSFYGGMISDQNLTRLFEFYNEVKLYLKTDGKSWHKPKVNLFDVTVSITEPNSSQSPSSSNQNADPCSQFVLFENTSEGLNIPIPRVSWASNASILFLPLKDHSIYAMNSINSTAILLIYYEKARFCLEQRYPAKLKYFESRFQAWLVNEILPHLVDDDVYFALGSVLTVMNKTRELFDSVLYMYAKQPKPSCKRANLIPLSKKTMIIILLILIETVWCCIALIYTCHARRKRDRASNVYLFVEPRHPDKKDECFSTQEIFRRRPFGLKDISSTTSKDREADAQTDVGMLLDGSGCCNSRCKCSQRTTNSTHTSTQPAAIEISSSLNLDTNLKIHNKKTSKRESKDCKTLSAEFDLCKVPTVSSEKMVNAVNTEKSRHHAKHKHDRYIDKKVKHLKTKEYLQQKSSVNLVQSQVIGNYLDEANFADSQFSVRNKMIGVSKSNISINTSSIRTLTKEQSVVTTDFQKTENSFYTTRPLNIPLPIMSTKSLSTELIVKHEVKNNEADCIKYPAETSVHSVMSVPTVKTVSFVDNEFNQNILSENISKSLVLNKSEISKLQIPIPTLDVNGIESELPLKETPINRIEQKLPEYKTNKCKHDIIINNPDSPKSNQVTYSETCSNQQLKAGSRHQKIEREHTFINISEDVKRKPDKLISKQVKISTKEKAQTNSDLEASILSLNRKESRATTEAQTKPTRLFTHKEMQGKYPNQKPYWEITIDEQQKDVYFDIKGTLIVDSKSVKKSKIPKLSVKTIISPRPAGNTSNIKTLIPQLKSKAADDSVLKDSEKNIKLNTSI